MVTPTTEVDDCWGTGAVGGSGGKIVSDMPLTIVELVLGELIIDVHRTAAHCINRNSKIVYAFIIFNCGVSSFFNIINNIRLGLETSYFTIINIWLAIIYNN